VCGLRGRGFIISNKVVRLSLLDVCLGLGLRVVGHSIKLDDVFVESKCRKLLNNEIVDVEMLYDFLKDVGSRLARRITVGYILFWEYRSSLFQVAREQFFPCYLPFLMTLVVLTNAIGVDLFMNS